MEKMTATEVLAEIAKPTTTFLGQTVPLYSTTIEIRERLTELSEAEKISPRAYWEALKVTSKALSQGQRDYEYETLNA
jgi:hypothetical protein